MGNLPPDAPAGQPGHHQSDQHRPQNQPPTASAAAPGHLARFLTLARQAVDGPQRWPAPLPTPLYHQNLQLSTFAGKVTVT